MTEQHFGAGTSNSSGQAGAENGNASLQPGPMGRAGPVTQGGWEEATPRFDLPVSSYRVALGVDTVMGNSSADRLTPQTLPLEAGERGEESEREESGRKGCPGP